MYRAQAIFPSNQAGIFLISSACPPFRLSPFCRCVHFSVIASRSQGNLITLDCHVHCRELAMTNYNHDTISIFLYTGSVSNLTVFEISCSTLFASQCNSLAVTLATLRNMLSPGLPRVPIPVRRIIISGKVRAISARTA